MAEKEWAEDRDDETGPGSETKQDRPKKEGNPARGKENETKTLQPTRGRHKAESWKANRVDEGDARKNAR